MERRRNQRGRRRRWSWLMVVAAGTWGCGESEANPTDPGPGDGGDTNRAPVASVGADRTVSAGLPVQLDGSASSDPDGDPLGYAWTLSVPSGSAATLDGASGATQSFTPDLPGDYGASLVVSDGDADSPAAQVTLTAEDNTASVTVDAAGGAVTSSDGLVHIVIPPGAVDAETEIRITRTGDGQLPEAVEAQDLTGITVYDLQPSGTTFNVPLEITLEIEDAVAASAGQVSMEPPFLFVESAGVLEGLDVEVRLSDVTPGAALVSAGLSHFSSLTVMEKSLGRHVLSVPTSAEVGVPFTASLATGVPGNEFTLDRVGVRHGRASERVDTLPGFQTSGEASELNSVLIENEYVCTEAGPGLLVLAVVPFVQDGTSVRALGYGAGAVDLRTPITCTQPVELDLVVREVNGPGILAAGFGGEDVLHGLGNPERWNPETNEVTPLGTVSGSSPLQIDEAGPNGTPFAVETFGRLYQYNEPSWNLIRTGNQDQMDQLVRGPDGYLYGATSWGDGRVVEWDPQLSSLTTRTLGLTNQVALWGNGSYTVGVEPEGDGNPTFNDARLWVGNAVGQDRAILSGAVDVPLDEWQRNRKQLVCSGRLSGNLTCLLTVGERSPGFLTDGQPRRMGVLRLVDLDPQQGTARVLEQSGDPVVGASTWVSDGVLHFAWSDQIERTVEVRTIGASGNIEGSWSQSVADWCPLVLDMAVTEVHGRVVLSCPREGEPGGFLGTIRTNFTF